MSHTYMWCGVHIRTCKYTAREKFEIVLTTNPIIEFCCSLKRGSSVDATKVVETREHRAGRENHGEWGGGQNMNIHSYQMQYH